MDPSENKENEKSENEMEMEGGEENPSPDMEGMDAEANKEGEVKMDESMKMEEDGKVVDEKVIHKILIPGVSRAYSS